MIGLTMESAPAGHHCWQSDRDNETRAYDPPATEAPTDQGNRGQGVT